MRRDQPHLGPLHRIPGEAADGQGNVTVRGENRREEEIDFMVDTAIAGIEKAVA